MEKHTKNYKSKADMKREIRELNKKIHQMELDIAYLRAMLDFYKQNKEEK